jgi:hypothetical protein
MTEEPMKPTERDAVEEDGDEIFTPMPTTCIRWNCGGTVKPTRGFHVCDRCHCSYGPAK